MGKRWWKDRQEIEWFKAHWEQGHIREEMECAWYASDVFKGRSIPSRGQVARKALKEGWQVRQHVLPSPPITVVPPHPTTPIQPRPLYAQESVYSTPRMQPLQDSTLSGLGIYSTAQSSMRGYTENYLLLHNWHPSCNGGMDNSVSYGNPHTLTPNPQTNDGFPTTDETMSTPPSVLSAPRLFSPTSSQTAASSPTRNNIEPTASPSGESQPINNDDSQSLHADAAPVSQDQDPASLWGQSAPFMDDMATMAGTLDDQIEWESFDWGCLDVPMATLSGPYDYNEMIDGMSQLD